MKAPVIVVAAAVVLLLSGCIRLESSPAPATEATWWDDYDPGLQERLQDLAAAKDCVGLQDNFDAAEANGTRYRADLMEYINDLMKYAGCYD